MHQVSCLAALAVITNAGMTCKTMTRLMTAAFAGGAPHTLQLRHSKACAHYCTVTQQAAQKQVLPRSCVQVTSMSTRAAGHSSTKPWSHLQLWTAIHMSAGRGQLGSNRGGLTCCLLTYVLALPTPGPGFGSSCHTWCPLRPWLAQFGF